MIRQDKQDVYWIVTVEGLISFDAKTKIHHYYYNRTVATQRDRAYSFTTGFSLDNSGRYWISSFGAGLNLFNPETGKFKSYKVHSGKNFNQLQLPGRNF
jgi:sugar lactone lactonase YvrE